MKFENRRLAEEIADLLQEIEGLKRDKENCKRAYEQSYKQSIKAIKQSRTWLGIPCLTARPNTERPVTISEGTNRLIESTADAIFAGVMDLMENGIGESYRPELWDGRAAKRIVQVIKSHFCLDSKGKN